MAQIPVLSIAPSLMWEGNDGRWSTFYVSIGTPPQNVQVLPSTSGSVLMTVMPQGCIEGVGQDLDNCDQRRGSFYTPSVSSSSRRAGDASTYYNLPLGAESQLGIPSATAEVGYDNVSLSQSSGGSSGYSLGNQTVFNFAVKEPFLGQFGLRPDPIRLPGYPDVHDALLTSVRESNTILGRSWSYTAGAQYRTPNAFGSLTLGGKDTSRFDTTNSVGFQLGIDNTRDLLVTMSAITISNTSPSPPTDEYPLIMYLDSTISQIYLPQPICNYFETALGLVWDNSTSLYLINDTQHTSLLQLNPSFAFTVASSSGSVNIVLPYAAFDLTASYPMLGNNANASNSSRYFPLQRAQNTSQYALGRTFLQEAYLMVDYDRQNFSLSQARFPSSNTSPGQPSTLEPIYPPGYSPSVTVTHSDNSGGLSTGAKAGIAVGVVIIAILAALAAFFIIRRRRRRRRQQSQEVPPASTSPPPYEMDENKPVVKEGHEPSTGGAYQKDYYGPPGELEGEQTRHELSDREGPLSELDASNKNHEESEGYFAPAKGRTSRIFELDVDAPVAAQQPLTPEPGRSDPFKSAPVSPTAGTPDPVRPGVVSPEPGTPEPVKHGPVSPVPSGSEVARGGPVSPEPTSHDLPALDLSKD